jgi:hypothetical protein
MQQRQPRLGDIVDDYCPRERRITNHAVVAMVGDEVKQTRCTTCEAEHEYKQARVPPQRRKKEGGGALYQQVLAGMPRKVAPALSSDLDEPSDPAPDSEPMAAAAPDPEPALPMEEPALPVEEEERELEVAVHRPLIRATLPRLTDEPPQRREPEFTIRNPQLTRPGKFGKNGFRGHRAGSQGQGFGSPGHRAGGQKHHGHGGNGNRQGGGRPGQAPHGNRAPRPGGHGHGRGGKKSPR